MKLKNGAGGMTSYFYEFNSDAGDNTHLWNYIQLTDLKTAFCTVCEKKIGQIENNE